MKKNITQNLYIILLIFIFSFSAFAQDTDKKDTQAPSPAKMGKDVELPEKSPETAEEYYDYANKLWRKNYGRGVEDKVLEYLNKALALKPDYAEAFYFRGFVNNRTDKHKEAIKDLTRLLELSPDELNAYQLRAESKIQLKDFKGALSDYDNFITRVGVEGFYTLGSLFERGKLKYFLKDYDGAIQDFSKAVSTNRSIVPYFFRAATYLKKGNKVAALEDFRVLAEYTDKAHSKSIQDYPEQYKEEEGYPNNEDPLAVLKKSKSDPNEIKVVTELVSSRIVAVDPKTGKEIEYNFPTLEEKLVLDNWFDFNSEKNYLTTFISDSSSVFYYYYGVLLAEQKKFGEAETAFTKALTYELLAEENASAWFERGKLRLADKRFEPAVRDFSWAISKNPNMVNAYLERGIAILMLGHDKIAQKDFDLYLAMNPEGKEVLSNRIAEAKKLRNELKQKKQK